MSWIDLRSELAGLIDGDSVGIAQGYWIVLRIYRIGEYSKYWNAVTNEAVGGPKYKFDDYLVRCISSPGNKFTSFNAVRTGEQDIGNVGLDEVNNEIFAIEHNNKFLRYPKTGDVIFKIDKYNSIDKPTSPIKATDRFEATSQAIAHGDHGRAEVILLLGARVHGES